MSDETKKSIEEVLATEGALFFQSVGASMQPLIKEGRDFIYLVKRPAERLKKYDVALYVRPEVTGRGHYVLHRVLRVYPDGTYWIVGDNCTSGETVSEGQIIGVLSAVKRKGKLVKVSACGYKLYVALWAAPYPVRFFFLYLKQGYYRIRHFGGNILRKLHLKK